jgi:hypothetical protein
MCWSAPRAAGLNGRASTVAGLSPYRGVNCTGLLQDPPSVLKASSSLAVSSSGTVSSASAATSANCKAWPAALRSTNWLNSQPHQAVAAAQRRFARCGIGLVAQLQPQGRAAVGRGPGPGGQRPRRQATMIGCQQIAAQQVQRQRGAHTFGAVHVKRKVLPGRRLHLVHVQRCKVQPADHSRRRGRPALDRCRPPARAGTPARRRPAAWRRQRGGRWDVVWASSAPQRQ